MTVTIYTTSTCPFCHSAKTLLTEKKVSFNEIDVTDNPKARDEMTKRADGRTSVPQIFFNDEHIGGCDDLYALEDAGLLDEKLAPAR